MENVVDEQKSSVDHALGLSSRIEELRKQIGNIQFQSRLLALNANVEAAHLKKGGAAFHAIANEMRRLTSSIEIANSNVAELTMSLPAIAANRCKSLQAAGKLRQFSLQHRD